MWPWYRERHDIDDIYRKSISSIFHMQTAFRQSKNLTNIQYATRKYIQTFRR